jgi:limonene-1,2-epoxide hydrolase
MPWFPDFVGAVELARRQTRADGEADPVGVYLDALNNGDLHALRNSWPGEVVVYDPRAGEVRGHRRLRQFVHRNQVWLAQRRARIEKVAATCVGGRAVVELLAHLSDGARETAWPVAVVAESADDRSVVFRTYCSQLPVDRRRHIRPPILPPVGARPGDVVGRYLAALQAGDTDAIVGTFTSQGYVREPIDATCIAAPMSCARTSTGASAPGAASACSTARSPTTASAARSSTTASAGGAHPVAPQAGMGVYERGPDGLLAAARLYDDIEAPVR